MGFHALEVGWIETTAFLSKTWTRFATGFQKVWESATSFVAKRMLEIQGLFDSSLDVEAAKRLVDQQLESRLAELDQGAQRDVAARETRRQRERQSAAELNEATLAEIGRQFEEARQALRSGSDERVAETQAALDEARRKLDEAIAEARRRRDEAEADESGPRRTVTDVLDELDDRLSSLGDRLTEGISVRGTFSAAAVAGLASSGNAAERTARATEQTAKNTKRLVDAAQSGGLTFA
jgi:polyhydroxyalkanoate synthesis regulator phasin